MYATAVSEEPMTREELLDQYESARQEQLKHNLTVLQKSTELAGLEEISLTLSMKVTTARDALLNRMDTSAQEPM